MWGRKGQVIPDRYHATILTTPTQVRRALCYVLHNAKKHGLRLPQGADPFSTAAWFDGWREELVLSKRLAAVRPFKKAGTWLLRLGWKRARGGKLSLAEAPPSAAPG